jgi:hypothetical protein
LFDDHPLRTQRCPRFVRRTADSRSSRKKAIIGIHRNAERAEGDLFRIAPLHRWNGRVKDLLAWRRKEVQPQRHIGHAARHGPQLGHNGLLAGDGQMRWIIQVRQQGRRRFEGGDATIMRGDAQAAAKQVSRPIVEQPRGRSGRAG